MKKEKTKKQIITALCPSIDHKTGKVISPKKDRRTKAQLLDILAHKEKQLREPVLTNIATDSQNYRAGYKDGYNAAKGDKPWWVFWNV